MTGTESETGRNGSSVASARRDIVAGGIVVAAILMLIGTGGSVAKSIVDTLNGFTGGADRILVATLLLNVALMLFGWRRYRDLAREVTERKAAEERAQTLASRDPLTGFLNRRSLAEEGASLMREAERRGRIVAMLMIDLDHFKTVNDLRGHGAGDELLRQVAGAILAQLPAGALAARLGGDEFACALACDADQPGIVEQAAEAIVERLARPFDLDDAQVNISASLGIARTEADCQSIEALMRRADIAMYSAKKRGRNRFAWFDASMERELNARNLIEAGLRRGIPRGEFVPYYEQQVDLVSGALHGFEVLARWHHPSDGLVVPDIFIPVAEECGMIGDLSMAVMRQAFEEAKNWDASLTLSVNISPGQLKDPWLAQKIIKLLLETGYPANRLEIEITETSLFENLGLAQSIIASLKNQGVRLALDDFGTGYSSLAHLRALPFDRIKIDKSFVISMNRNDESAAIVNAIARLGDSLGLPVTAEGIEDGAIQARLKTLGLNKGQGWHFGKPLSLDEVRGLLAERSLLPAARAAPIPPARIEVRRAG